MWRKNVQCKAMPKYVDVCDVRHAMYEDLKQITLSSLLGHVSTLHDA